MLCDSRSSSSSRNRSCQWQDLETRIDHDGLTDVCRIVMVAEPNQGQIEEAMMCLIPLDDLGACWSPAECSVRTRACLHGASAGDLKSGALN